MKKFKARNLLKPYFLIPLCLIVLVALAFLIWFLLPRHSLSVVVVDKTVPATAADSWSYLEDVSNNYRKHIGLYWLMDYMKITNPVTGKYYDHEKDYYGPKLDENNRIVSSNSIKDLHENPDILYLSDTYGVEIYDDRGLTQEEMNTVSRCRSSGSVIIGEQDILTTATDGKVRRELEQLFGITTTGWVGRYIYDLQDLKDVPYWAPDMWQAKYGQEWNCSGPGILLVSRDGDILVLEEKTDFESKNLLSITVEEEFREEFGKHSVNYYNWFELIEADKATDVIATYHFNVNSTGAEELAAVSDTTTFAAVTRKAEKNKGTAYYFAGDFNDYVSKKQVSCFLFADTFFRLLAFDRDGDVSNFYWNFYQPLMKTVLRETMEHPRQQEEVPQQQNARVTDDGFELADGDGWKPLPIKGFNIHGEAPGGSRYVYSRDYSYYSSLLYSLGQAGGNCVRAYDLLPPEFYRALMEYNRTAPTPVYLMQGILTPPTVSPGESRLHKEAIQQNIRAAIDGVHGAGTIAGNGTREEMAYTYDVSNYVIAYILDPRLDEEAVDAIMADGEQPEQFSGRWLSAKDSRVEALLAEMADYALDTMQTAYGHMQPISVCADARRLTGASWTDPRQTTFKLDGLTASAEAPNLYFTSYSLDADDQALLDNEADFGRDYMDADGPLPWGGYIREVRTLCTGPLFIDRAGLSTNTDMFEKETSVNNLSEQEQGEGLVRMLKAADNTDYMGMLIADLNDNWCASSPEAEPYTVPLSNTGLWHNATDRAETTGVVAVEAKAAEKIAMQLNDNNPKSMARQAQISYNEGYLFLTIMLDKDIDYDIHEMIIGLDTYQRNDGEYYYDKNYFANSQSGMEYIIKFESKTAAALYVAHSYNRNAGNFISQESYTADYDLVSTLRYGNFMEANTHFYQTGVTVHLRIPWAMLNFTDPANALVVNGTQEGAPKTTATDGIIFSLLIGNKKTMDTDYIFPESKKSAGYKRLNLMPWTEQEVQYSLREKESCTVLRHYFAGIQS